MAFTVIIPFANMASANAALEAGGWGSANFIMTARPSGSPTATNGVLHHYATDAAFRAACAALPSSVVIDAPTLTVALTAHLAQQNLVLDG